jgi:Cof subfamily protein (haloacid dehalogenase superfamily)
VARQHDLAEIAGLDPRPDIRFIATDLDGTLLSDDKQVHDEFWPLVDELNARGVTVAPASGRQLHSLLDQFAPVAHEMVFIAENGAFVVDGRTGAEISSTCLPVESARAVVRMVRDLPSASTVLCGKASAYVEQNHESFMAEVAPYYRRLQVVDDLTAVSDDVLKVAVFDAASAEHGSGVALGALRPELQVVISGEHWVDVMSPRATKGQALRQVQQALGVTRDQTMVFGDFPNDLEMMDEATYSFAMANAHPLLRERAAWTAPTNNTNGVVRTIRSMLGMPEPGA